MGKIVEKRVGVIIRKVVEIHGSFYLCIPRQFINNHGLQRGDKLIVSWGEVLKVSPMERDNG